jgi:hypothetical protein
MGVVIEAILQDKIIVVFVISRQLESRKEGGPGAIVDSRSNLSR